MIKQEEQPKLPISLMTKLYDATGSLDGSNKGYFLFYINDKGEPVLTTKTSNLCVSTALHRIIDLYNQEHLE